MSTLAVWLLWAVFPFAESLPFPLQVAYLDACLDNGVPVCIICRTEKDARFYRVKASRVRAEGRVCRETVETYLTLTGPAGISPEKASRMVQGLLK